MKHKIKTGSRVIGFIAVFLVLFISLNQLLQPEWFDWNNYYTVNGFYEEPENTIETVFLGPSTMLSAVIPTQLYQDYGICAYSLATEQQPMLASYYWLEEAYRLHSDTLKTAVVEVSMIRKDAANAFYHKAFDAMKLSGVKLRAARDYAESGHGSALNMLMPVMSYHSRWNKLNSNDFTSSFNPINGTRGYHYTPGVYTSAPEFNGWSGKDFTLDTEAEPAEFHTDALAAFEKMVAFCQEHDIRLVPFKSPTWAWNSSEHRTVQDLADRNNLEFIDLNFGDWHEEYGYIHVLDTFDASHQNFYGAAKVTDYLGRYLTENCETTDVRGNDAYAHMEEQLDLYNLNYVEPSRLQSAPDIVSYLKEARSEENTIFLTVRNEAAAAFTAAQREYFSSIGLTSLANLNPGECYLALIEHGTVVFEAIKTHAEIHADTTALFREGTLENGESYLIKSGMQSVSCMISGKEYLANEDGLHVVVYKQNAGKVLDATCFKTNIESYRAVYGSETTELIRNCYDQELIKSHNLYYYLNRMLNTETNELAASLQKLLTRNIDSLFKVLDYYLKDENNIVCISAYDEASSQITGEVRALLADYGLPLLAQLEYRQPYIGIIGSNTIHYEQLGRTDEVVEYASGNIRVQSAGLDAGPVSAIWIGNINYSLSQRGLNIVVYNTDSRNVIYQAAFDTYAEPIPLP